MMSVTAAIMLSILSLCGGFVLGLFVGIDSERHKIS